MIFNGKSLVSWGSDTCELSQPQALVLVLLALPLERLTCRVGHRGLASTHLMPALMIHDHPVK